MSVHGVRISIAVGEIIWLVVSIGALGIIGLVASYFATNAQSSATQDTPEESDSEQGAFDDPHSEEWTR